MPKDTSIKSVLIIGSGPIVIGQACEFDYAGSQSARSIREEGIEVILINSNPATIMTDPSMADHVYLKPLTTKSIIEILKANPQIDAVLPTMGGQTALNLCIEADEKGIWKDFGVRLIGVDINAINITEDRAQFKNLLEQEEPVGKKLDFLIQEMNRETNTIGSKSGKLEITNLVIEMKTVLEDIREQIQNIE